MATCSSCVLLSISPFLWQLGPINGRAFFYNRNNVLKQKAKSQVYSLCAQHCHMAHTYRLPKFNLELADKLVSRKHAARLAQKFRLYIAYDDSPEPGIVPVAVLLQKNNGLAGEWLAWNISKVRQTCRYPAHAIRKLDVEGGRFVALDNVGTLVVTFEEPLSYPNSLFFALQDRLSLGPPGSRGRFIREDPHIRGGPPWN